MDPIMTLGLIGLGVSAVIYIGLALIVYAIFMSLVKAIKDA